MTELLKVAATLIILVAVCGSNSIADDLRKMTFDDLYSIPSCSDPQISWDGKQVIFGLHTSDPSKNEEQDHIWIMNSDGSNQRQLTFGVANEWRPRWAQDDKSIYFLSDREDGAQIWQMSMVGGGEPHKLTSIPTSVAEYELTPRYHGIIFVSRVYPECISDSCNKAMLDKADEERNMPKLYNKLLYRHYNHWNDGRVNRIFVANSDGSNQGDVYKGIYDTPTTLLGGNRDFDIDPEDIYVCFSMASDSTPAVWPNNDLYIVSRTDGQIEHFTNSPGLEIMPRYSPDGSYLAYLGTARSGYETDQRDIMVFDNAREASNLTDDFDYSVEDYTWDQSSQYIYFTVLDRGLSKIWRVNISSRKIEPVQFASDAVLSDMQISPDGKFLIANRTHIELSMEFPDKYIAPDFHRFDIDTPSVGHLTHFADKAFGNLMISPTDDFWFVGTLGDSVQGFLTKPPDFNAKKKYPLVLLIHGGPQFCWLQNFNYYGWNTQLMAAQGYVVLQINPHGSAGYGIKFQEYVSGNWGKGDYDDLMMGVDYVIQRYPFVDSSRMAALGRSYGGFMVNWICGHTDRFKCLISVDGTYNHISEYGSTDELWFPEWEYKGTPWSNRDEYVRSSPATYAQNFKTPTMIIHGQKDYRVDLSEGLQMFTTLQRMGVPSEILYYPAEGHQAGGLEEIRITYEKQFEWLAKWLKK